ncbi:uncharacterized protein [Lepisosteus oculatus]|uniref:uncharacterized protein n=1 Tax=Lepisosteus oculatus TaxID=7918 RepID=UPI0035F506F9
MWLFVFCLCFAGTQPFSILGAPRSSGDPKQMSENLLYLRAGDELMVDGGVNLTAANHSSVQSDADSLQDVSVSCADSDMVIRVKQNLYGFSSYDGRLTLGSNCGNNSMDPISGDLLFSYSLQECDSQRLMSPGYIAYRNVLHYVPSQRAQQDGVPRINVDIQCSYAWQEYYFDRFSLTLMNSAWTAASLANVYSMGDVLHFQARGYLQSRGERLFLKSCYATLSKDPQSLPQYSIIENYGCMNKDLGVDSRFHSPRADDAIHFSVDTKELKVASKMYLHCVVFMSRWKAEPHTKSCSFNVVRKIWEDLEYARAVCDCCDTNCTASPQTSIITDVVSTGPILIEDTPLKSKAPARDRGLLWFRVKGGDGVASRETPLQDAEGDLGDTEGDAEEDVEGDLNGYNGWDDSEADAELDLEGDTEGDDTEADVEGDLEGDGGEGDVEGDVEGDGSEADVEGDVAEDLPVNLTATLSAVPANGTMFRTRFRSGSAGEEGDAEGDVEGDLEGDTEGDDGEADVEGDAESDLEGDGGEGDVEGDIEGDTEGDAEGDLEGDSSEGDVEGDLEGDGSEADVEGDVAEDLPVNLTATLSAVPANGTMFRTRFRSGSAGEEGDAEGDVEGDLEGDTEGDNGEGDVERDLEGDLEGDAEGDVERDLEGDLEGDAEGDNGEGDVERDLEGDLEGDTEGDNGEGDVERDLEGDLEGDAEGDNGEGDVESDLEGG